MMAVLITAELATLAGARGQGCWSGAEAQQLHPPITGQVFPAKNTSLPAATHTLPHHSTLGRARQAWSSRTTLPGGELTFIKYMPQPKLEAQRPSLPPVGLCCA